MFLFVLLLLPESQNKNNMLIKQRLEGTSKVYIDSTTMASARCLMRETG